ncbi:MAG: ABC transporter ATP-binding protein [Pseudomonadota bacterium]
MPPAVPSKTPDLRPPQSADPLCLQQITRTYAGKTPIEVLRGIDLRVRAGELVSLMGPSGCGKSTLLHIAGLLEPPTSGEVWIAGQPGHSLGITGRAALRRGHIGFVFQAHHLLAEYTALENIILPQRIAGTAPRPARARAADLLAQVGLADRADHLPSDLSGGEQQRVAIARAMACDPDLLLADEPTGNLDEKTGWIAFEALADLVRGGKTGLLIVTHNPEIGRCGDRSVTLSGGLIAPNPS